MAHNVQGWRRFCCRISEPKSHKFILTRLLCSQGSKNVGGGRRGNGFSHDLANRNPGAALYGRRNANRVLCGGFALPLVIVPPLLIPFSIDIVNILLIFFFLIYNIFQQYLNRHFLFYFHYITYFINY